MELKSRQPKEELPAHEQCNCCTSEWTYIIRHKHGTSAKLCVGCLANYVKFLPAAMVKTMKAKRRVQPSALATRA